MGMHFGVIAAQTSVDSLASALSRAVEGYSIDHELTSLRAIPDRVGGEPPLVAGHAAGVAFLMDPGMLVSSDADAIVEASAKLNGVVGVVGAETTSGTYWLTVASRGLLSRLHFNSIWGQSEPYDVGQVLPVESEGPLEDVDGIGLLRVLSRLGYDFRSWAAGGGPFSVLRVDYRIGPPGPLGAAQNAFAEMHSTFDPKRLPTPVVVSRGNGAFDMVAVGSRLPDGTIVQADKPKGGFFGRLRAR